MTKRRTCDETISILDNLGYKYEDEYRTSNGIKRVIFTDSFGYKYDGDFRNLVRKIKPRAIGKENLYALENISRWLKINHKKFILNSNSNYTGNNKKLYFKCLICEEVFDTTWKNIYSQNHGCPFCSGKRLLPKNALDKVKPDLLIEWDYNKNTILPNSVSVGSNKRVWWICSKCLYSWETPVYSRVIYGKGCKKCSHTIGGLKNRKKNSDFIDEIYDLVGDEYEILGEYVSSKQKIKIRHELCSHEWEIEPQAFLNGNRCPKCKFTKGERNITIWLEKNNIEFISQFKFEDCKHKRKLPFDFYLPKHNFCIEYDGILHYEDKFNNPEEFYLIKKRDRIKTKYCKNKGINLLRISYMQFDDIEKILKGTLLKK